MERDLIRRIAQIPLRQSRRIIAIAGPPASGKSTFAATLEAKIPNACVLPLDGFHRDNANLERTGMLDRKGAPDTFDVVGFAEVLQACRLNQTIEYPTFDRALDRTVPAGGQITSQHETILVEGNYLLLDSSPWDGLQRHWDLTIMLTVPESELRRRLIERWLQHGFDRSAAVRRADYNDLPNARRVQQSQIRADIDWPAG